MNNSMIQHEYRLILWLIEYAKGVLPTTFSIGWDIQKSLSDPTTAISTRSGNLVRVGLANMTADRASECWMTLLSFGVCAIRESGVTLLT